MAFVLSGCSTVRGWIPSFWDDNQSAMIIEVRLHVEQIDCSKPQAAQVARVGEDLARFTLYSESKGWRQGDVLKLTSPMTETVNDWSKRVSAEGYKENPVYCGLKKQLLTAQAKRAAEVVLGRF